MEKFDSLDSYLAYCNKDSVDSLTDKQVIDWMDSDNVTPTTRCIFEDAIAGGIFGTYPREDALAFARESMKTGKEIWAEINTIEGSFDGSTEDMEESYKLILK